MSSHKKIFIISMQITIITLIHLSPTTKANMVQDVCKGDQPCLSIFNQHAQASAAKDKRELAEIGLHIAIENVTDSQNFTQQLAEKTAQPELKQRLVTCAAAFKEACGQYRAALGDLSVDPPTATYDAFVAGDGPSYCREGLEKEGFKVGPVLSRVEYVFTFYKVLNMVIDQLPIPPHL